MEGPRCPICRKAVVLPKDGHLPEGFPFCSERCRQIDLGRWADGTYLVPGRSVLPEEPRE